PKKFWEEDYFIYHNQDYYTFDNSGTNVTSRLDTEKLIYKNSEKKVVYYDYTDSYSKIFGVNSDFNHYVERYESGGIFHNDFYVNSFYLGTYANEKISEGWVTLEYSKIYSDYKFLGTIPFLPGNPTVKSTVVLEIPENIEIEIREMNFDGYEISRTEEQLKKSKKITYTFSKIDFEEDCYYCPSGRHYEPHLVVIYKSVIKRGEKQDLLPDVSNLYGWYSSLVAEVEDDPEQISDLVAQFADIPKGEEQVKAVFDWIKNNIRYIAFESGMAGFRPDECQDVYNNRYGDCKGMSNLCKNVLIQLGHDARLAWIGTRKEVPYDYSIPSLIVDNHMIVALKLDGEWIFVDPTETYGKHKEYAFRIQGRPVLIENGEDYIISEVPGSAVDSDYVRRKYTYTFDPQNLVGIYEADMVMTGEPKKYVLANYNMTLAQDREDALVSYLRPYDTGSLELISERGLTQEADSLHFSYRYSSPSGIIDLGNEYYLDIDPSRDLESLKLEDKRKADYYFGERYNRETIIEMIIPEGYSVTHVPKSFSNKTDFFEMSIQLTETADKITIEKRIIIPEGIVSNDQNEEFQNAIGKLISYYEDTIILTQN
ncbi:MAG TPA: transglutaminase domain-containing protein, partial [Cryomorphaceae bacterium]|nr:transglutaminase domain-containing protein [Cryomorphaceae bacterium]